MPTNRDAAQVLARYPSAGSSPGLESLGSAGGFSGARIWRVTSASASFCLRCWPIEHPDRARLQFIHAVIHYASQRGAVQLAAPLLSRDGDSFVAHRGRFWELTRWMPGRADFHQQPTATRLRAAMAALAQFHLAAAGFTSAAENATLPRMAVSPGLASRLEMLARLRSGGMDTIAAAITEAGWPQLKLAAHRLVDLFPRAAPIVQPNLAQAATQAVPLQPCLRDIWHDHVLFSGDEVTGIVDFGALRLESVAGDVARLLGSLVGDDAQSWRQGLAAYESLRPLSPAERALLRAFDESAVLLSGVNWLDWIYLQSRQFEQRDQIVARLHETLGRLQHLIDQGGSPAGQTVPLTGS